MNLQQDNGEVEKMLSVLEACSNQQQQQGWMEEGNDNQDENESLVAWGKVTEEFFDAYYRLTKKSSALGREGMSSMMKLTMLFRFILIV